VAIRLGQNGAKRFSLDRQICAIDVRGQCRVSEVTFWVRTVSLAYVENHGLCCLVGVYLFDAKLWR
jgi:hypothetical protein